MIQNMKTFMGPFGILCWVATMVVMNSGCSTLGFHETPSAGQSAQNFTRTFKNEVNVDYFVFLPEEFDPESIKRWPMIFFLHGAGERGSELEKVAVHGPPMIVKERPDFPFIVVSPQCPTDQLWDNDTLIRLLDEVTRIYPVDPTRVYLTGLSMGGFGTWSLGLNHPERFAAMAPICGGGNFIEIRLQSDRQREALKTLPIWAFHGAKDSVVPIDESKRMIETAKKLGVEEANLYVFPDAGHNSWTETYGSDELYDWFLQHKRPRPLVRKD
jgi:predicted peptidase